jgi:hypothetical protein
MLGCSIVSSTMPKHKDSRDKEINRERAQTEGFIGNRRSGGVV